MNNSYKFINKIYKNVINRNYLLPTDTGAATTCDCRENKQEPHMRIDPTKLQIADDGYTCHYGGTVTINGRIYQASGSDRDDLSLDKRPAFVVLKELAQNEGYSPSEDDTWAAEYAITYPNTAPFTFPEN